MSLEVFPTVEMETGLILVLEIQKKRISGRRSGTGPDEQGHAREEPSTTRVFSVLSHPWEGWRGHEKCLGPCHCD